MNKLVLFDIDGTLLWTDGAGRRAIHRALVSEMGVGGPTDGYRFDGKTDPQIVRELLSAAGHPQADSADHVLAVCRRYVELLEGELMRSAQHIRVLAGVHALLTGLEEGGDAVVGLLTGNLHEGAALKLRYAGIDPARFRVGAFGSDAAERSALPAFAVKRAAELMGRQPRGADVVIIGDTPADVMCGRSLGARAIGVASGSYRSADLLAAGAFAVFESLTDSDAVLAAIFA
jgi:phosphoglycolate phosphatase